MRAWHTDGSAVELALHLSRMQLSKLPGIVARARRYNPGWGGELARCLSRKLAPQLIRTRLSR